MLALPHFIGTKDEFLCSGDIDGSVGRASLAFASVFYVTRAVEVIFYSDQLNIPANSAYGAFCAACHVGLTFHDVRSMKYRPQTAMVVGRHTTNRLIALAACVVAFGVGARLSSVRDAVPSLGLVGLGMCAMLSLDIFGRALDIIFGLFGISFVEPIQNHPELSTSVAEFWGKRWNSTVRRMLHIWIYKPLAVRGVSRSTCVLATFTASAAVHGYPLKTAGPLYAAGISSVSFYFFAARDFYSHRVIVGFKGAARTCASRMDMACGSSARFSDY